jgi:hypothetical protein
VVDTGPALQSTVIFSWANKKLVEIENKKRKTDLKMLQVKWLDFKYTNALLKSYNFCL